MSFMLFKESKILAPLKCGTRYLKKCLLESPEHLLVGDIRSKLFINNLKTIIVRSPFEHMSSALFTELQNSFKEDGSVDMIEFELILDRFKYTKGKIIDGHWSRDIYDNLYWYWRRNYKNIEVVQLKDLSIFLISENIELKPYSADDYNFNSIYTKEDLLLFIKLGYQDLWEDLMEQVEYSQLYYDALINRTILEIKLI